MSNDQFVVRTGLLVLSAVVAVGLRLWAIFSKRRVADDRQGDCGDAAPPNGPLNIEPRP